MHLLQDGAFENTSTCLTLLQLLCCHLSFARNWKGLVNMGGQDYKSYMTSEQQLEDLLAGLLG